MKKLFILLIMILICSINYVFARTEEFKDAVLKNRLFSISIPQNLKGFYTVKKEKNKISIYHKNSKHSGFGGFAFGIKAYKNPADHAVLPGSRKLGELTDKKGNLYDIVLKHPTDVQYDYTKSETPPESFKLLYDLGENINIKGINGATYFKNQGMKGEDLYQSILEKYKTALIEKWDSDKLEKENMSYMYNIIPSNKIGYTYYDINADGIDELVIGEIAQGNWRGVIYDIYTMVDRKPAHVISGGQRNRYYVCDNSFVCREYSSGAAESGVDVYNLVENSTELFPQVSFKYDGYKNPKNPYFISYSDENYENYPEKEFRERKKIFEKYERFNYIPLNNIQITDKLKDKYNPKKDYFDYSVVLEEFPKDYYYTTVKINKSKERILIITNEIDKNNNSNQGLFYYFDKNGFVYPLGLIESGTPFTQSINYLYYNDENKDIKFYMSDKKLEIIKSIANTKEERNNIVFATIKSADKFKGDFGEPAGDDIKKVTIDGFYFEYHKGQYKREYIKNLMKECIKEGVKTQVQMYCQMVKKLHPEN
ncbi:MAG: hypothetical protein IJ877_01325 [Candidatus Gastranaerophilales bacterium]|nr:hypothetical protein [Candidatus Gastranaerophilales bacterium]